MPAEEAVVEDPVLVFETLEERVLAEWVLASTELVVRALTLFFKRVDTVR